MYIPTVWQDEVVEYPYRYTETVNDDGTVEHTPAPGEELQEGTPQSATNFNHAENGIHDAHIAAAIFIQYSRHKADEVDGRLDEHDEEFSAEVGTVYADQYEQRIFRVQQFRKHSCPDKDQKNYELRYYH